MEYKQLQELRKKKKNVCSVKFEKNIGKTSASEHLLSEASGLSNLDPTTEVLQGFMLIQGTARSTTFENFLHS